MNNGTESAMEPQIDALARLCRCTAGELTDALAELVEGRRATKELAADNLFYGGPTLPRRSPEPSTAEKHLIELVRQFNALGEGQLPPPGMAEIQAKFADKLVDPLAITLADLREANKEYTQLCKDAGVGRRPAWGWGYVRNAYLRRQVAPPKVQQRPGAQRILDELHARAKK